MNTQSKQQKQQGAVQSRPAVRRRKTGMALATVLILISVVVLTFLTLTNLSITALRLTSSGRDKAISLSLAEAGVDDAVNHLETNAFYAGTVNPISLTVDGASLGDFAVRTVAVNQNLVDVFSTGRTINGADREVRARVNLSGLSIGDGAMLSNGDVNINGSVLVQTYPLDRHNAHVRANEDVVIDGATSVDGRVAAAGTVSMPYGSSTDTLYPLGQPNAARIPFPTQATINKWKSQWVADAQAGTIMGGITGSATIVGPAYIDGDITLNSGDVLTITGTGPIYVNGSVTMKGHSTLINSSHLVVSGKFKQVGSTATEDVPEYLADDTTSYVPPALISLSNDPDDAIALTGGATNNQYSVIYAVNGGIDVQGNTYVRGSLVAGGKGSKINASGNYTHDYPNNAVTGVKFANNPTVVSWIEL